MVFDFESAISNSTEASNALLNNIADTIRFIKLETTPRTLLSNINFHFYPWNNSYIVSSGVGNQFSGVLTFDNKGNFERVLLDIGNGPNELGKGNYEWFVDETAQELIVVGRGRALAYSLQNQTSKYIQTKRYCFNLLPMGNKCYASILDLFTYSGETDVPYLYLFDKNGKTEKEFYYPQKRDISYTLKEGTNEWPYETYALSMGRNKRVLFKDVFNDTIYTIQNNVLKPYWYFHTGKMTAKVKDAHNIEKKAACIYFEKKSSESAGLVFANYAYNRMYNCSVWEKQTEKLIINTIVDTNDQTTSTSMVNNSHFIRYRTPNGKIVLLGISLVCDNTLYAIIKAKDAMEFLPGIDEESNPVVMEVKLTNQSTNI